MVSRKEKSKAYEEELSYLLEELKNTEVGITQLNTEKEKCSFPRHLMMENEDTKHLVQNLRPYLLHKILQGDAFRSKRIQSFVLSLPAINQALLLNEYADKERESVLKGCEEGKKQQINANVALLKLIENSEQDKKTPLTGQDDSGSSKSSPDHIVLAAKSTNAKQRVTSQAKAEPASSEVIYKTETNDENEGKRRMSSNESIDEAIKGNIEENNKKGSTDSSGDSTSDDSTFDSTSDDSTFDSTSDDSTSEEEEG
jgi:hypothetical protein